MTQLEPGSDRREYPRLAIAPMYSTVQARRVAGASGVLEGHAYDISQGGVRIELDEALEPGEAVSMRLVLPGASEGVAAMASVVWVGEVDDDPGPRRMALRFTDFQSAADGERLATYLDERSFRRAA